MGRIGPGFGAEAADGAFAASASFTLGTDNTARVFSAAASVYLDGRQKPVAVAIGLEFDRIGGNGLNLALLGPTATVSYRLVHNATVSVVPEVQGVFLIPVGQSANNGPQVGAAARVLLASPAGAGARTYVAPAVSRVVGIGMSSVDPDRVTYGVSIEAGLSLDL